jgi:hypothetical protein
MYPDILLFSDKKLAMGSFFFWQLNVQYFGNVWYPRKQSYIKVEYCVCGIVNANVNMTKQLHVFPTSEIAADIKT